ncbi:MAG: hypothetical protein GY698_04795 [Actinomycetia bacterium]|nr:hypothetical protein [Actinomycetes bacterium]
MAISRADRRRDRVGRVRRWFGEDEAPAALDLLEVLELAWHDCYTEISPSEDIIDDVLLLSDGDLAALIRAVRLATTDWRDLKIAATERRNLP